METVSSKQRKTIETARSVFANSTFCMCPPLKSTIQLRLVPGRQESEVQLSKLKCLKSFLENYPDQCNLQHIARNQHI